MFKDNYLSRSENITLSLKNLLIVMDLGNTGTTMFEVDSLELAQELNTDIKSIENSLHQLTREGAILAVDIVDRKRKFAVFVVSDDESKQYLQEILDSGLINIESSNKQA